MGYALGALIIGLFLQQQVIENRANKAGFENLKRGQKGNGVGAETSAEQLRKDKQEQGAE